MKNIVIVTKGTNTLRYSINTDTNKVSKTWVDPVISGNKNDTRINSLSAIVKTLKQVNEIDAANTEPITIYGINLVNDLVKSGTPLLWLHNGGKKMDDSEVDKVELELWDEFYTLYQANIRRVIFKDQTTISNVVKSGRSRYGITTEAQNVAKYINAAWEEVNAKTAQLEEVETDCI